MRTRCNQRLHNIRVALFRSRRQRCEPTVILILRVSSIYVRTLRDEIPDVRQMPLRRGVDKALVAEIASGAKCRGD